MRLRYRTFILLLLALTTAAMASVKEDIESGLSIEQAIRDNMKRGASIIDTARQAMRAVPKGKKSVLAAALQIAPSEAPALVELAIANGVPAGIATMMGLRASKEQAAEILKIGISADESKAPEILKSALRAGVDPEVVIPLANEYVDNAINAAVDNQETDGPKRILTAEEILEALEEGGRQDISQQKSDLPVLVMPPVNGGSDRLPSPN